MKVVVAADSFKGCMTSSQVGEYVKEGIHQYDESIDVQTFSIADGGEGTVMAFYETCGGELVEAPCSDAYGKRIHAQYALLDNGQTAVIEVANIIGLSMVERSRRMPLFASSYGVGMVIKDALNRGCKRIIIGLGGSATNDGGMGLLQALGVLYYDSDHQYLSPQAVSLEKVRYIDFNRFHGLGDVELIAACDVKNKLLGENGATFVFGKQKGLYPTQLKRVDAGMENYRNQIQRYKQVDLNEFEGGGAAGGIGSVLIGLLNAKMIPGIELLLSYSKMEEEVKDCTFVITGEGQSDAQTAYGKVPMGILKMAQKYNKPCIILSGALGKGYEVLYEEGFAGIYSIADCAMSFPQALAMAPEKLKAGAYSLIRTIDTFYQGNKE